MNRIILITGPSGSGKTTLQNELIKRGWGRPLNFTTRQPRDDKALIDIDSEGDYTSSELSEYIFLSKKNFLTKYGNGDFLEQTNYGGNYYGVSKFLNKDVNIVIVLDPVGRNMVMEYLSRSGIEYETYYIEISPKLQEERLFGRGDDSEDVIRRSRDFKWFSPTDKCIRLDGRRDVEELADFIIKRNGKL